jgi:hypothetical protein
MPDKPVSQFGTIKQVQTIGGSKPGTSPTSGKQNTPNKNFATQPLFKSGFRNGLVRGTVATFGYNFWKHDPYPLVLCCGPDKHGNVCAINMHYLTLNYVKSVIKQYCNNQQFNYGMIKGDVFAKNAYRSYKPFGVKGIRIFDGNFLAEILGRAKSYNPAEIDKIRQEIQTQIRAKMQKSAEELTQQTGTSPNKPQADDNGL